ncbi:MAG: tripartite tricarboxylate transporter substrate binding protein [Betaproteobacteria bacterium]|nr:tripartite tricarboxylate transporter substrate binding protein [Betaproteobacteria bacterium]
MVTRRNVLAAGIASSLFGYASFGIRHAEAQDSSSWPTRPVKLVVAFGAGGMNDITARVLASNVTPGLGQSMIVENRSGAGGVVGTEVVAKAKPDGYTVLLGTSSQLVTNVALYSKLPFDVEKDFTSVALVCRTPQMLLCKQGLPVKSLAEFAALARSRPGQMNYGTVGQGSITHVAASFFLRTAGIRLEPIHYRGIADASVALVRGDVDMIYTAPIDTVIEYVKSGQAKALATSVKRLPALPEVPTFQEAGMQQAESYTWNAIVVPAATPRAIVGKLNAKVNEALQLPPMKAYFEKSGQEPLAGFTPEESDKFWKKELTTWLPRIRSMGITLG